MKKTKWRFKGTCFRMSELVYSFTLVAGEISFWIVSLDSKIVTLVR